MTDGESYVRARWAAEADELRGQLDAAGRTEVLLRARVAELEEALGPFAEWWRRFGGGSLTRPPDAGIPAACYRAFVALLSSGAGHAGDGGQAK